jgi:nucleoside-diphosphate-sugar epimerase
LFDVPLDNRIEFGHTRDIGAALARAAGSEGALGKTLLLGGGPRCQFTFREMVGPLLKAMGVGMLPDAAFARTPFCTDWLDSRESEALLHYQTRGLDDYAREMAALLGPRRVLIRCFRPLVRAWVLQQSPYWRQRPRRDAKPRRKAVPGSDSTG